ncbi:hypothetical protein VH1807_contig00052-0090 [Vibrio harveyi]|nr:hypothetical protein VH1807_contig00052-0090 [Vibrio harveyi]
MSDTKLRVLAERFSQHSIDFLEMLKDKTILVVVERLSIKRSVMSDGELIKRF